MSEKPYTEMTPEERAGKMAKLTARLNPDLRAAIDLYEVMHEAGDNVEWVSGWIDHLKQPAQQRQATLPDGDEKGADALPSAIRKADLLDPLPAPPDEESEPGLGMLEDWLIPVADMYGVLFEQGDLTVYQALALQACAVNEGMAVQGKPHVLYATDTKPWNRPGVYEFFCHVVTRHKLKRRTFKQFKQSAREAFRILETKAAAQQNG